MFPNTRFMTNTLYTLKRSYGKQVSIYRETESLNLETGVKTLSNTVIDVRKAIVLSSTWRRKQELAMLSSAFKYGGEYDSNTKDIIIELKDLPKDFEPSNDDFIVVDKIKYKIMIVHVYDDRAVILTAKALSGINPKRQLTQKVSEYITIMESNDVST